MVTEPPGCWTAPVEPTLAMRRPNRGEEPRRPAMVAAALLSTEVFLEM